MTGTQDHETTMLDLATGSAVFTADGVQLGDIKEVRPDSFKLDTARSPDYWLLRSTVESASDERVRLRLTEAEVERERMPEPVEGEGAPKEPLGERDNGFLIGGGNTDDLGRLEDEALTRRVI